MFGWLGELLRLRVDTGHNHQYIERDLIVFVEAREADVPSGTARGMGASLVKRRADATSPRGALGASDPDSQMESLWDVIC
jgi:hypothetical protein